MAGSIGVGGLGVVGHDDTGVGGMMRNLMSGVRIQEGERSRYLFSILLRRCS